MDAEEARKRTYEFMDEVFNKKNLGHARARIAEDFVEHQEMPGISNDKQGAIQIFQMMFSAFPDMKVDVQDVIVDGHKVAIVGTYSGTHEGEFMGIPATGKSVSMGGIDVVRIDDDGSVHEHWGIADTMGMMMQMGVIPPPGQ